MNKLAQLVFTTTAPYGMFCEAKDAVTVIDMTGEKVEDITGLDDLKGRPTAWIHGEAMNIAGYDRPFFLRGNVCQLDLPVEEQDIVMLLPDGPHKCKARYDDAVEQFTSCYLIELK